MPRDGSRRHPTPPARPQAAESRDLPSDGTAVDTGLIQQLAASMRQPQPDEVRHAAAQHQPAEDADDDEEILADDDVIEEEPTPAARRDGAVPVPPRRAYAEPVAGHGPATSLDDEFEGSQPGPVLHRHTEPLPPAEQGAPAYRREAAPAHGGAAGSPYHRPDFPAFPGNLSATPVVPTPMPLPAQPTLIYAETESSGGRLVCVSGNDRGREFPLTVREVSVGRGANNEVVLADIAVSRRHIAITREGGAYALRDLRSGNGTFINGRRTDAAQLVEGDQIEIGNTVLRFVTAGGGPPGQGLPPPPPAAPLTPGRHFAPTAPAPARFAPPPAYAPVPQLGPVPTENLPPLRPPDPSYTPIVTQAHMNLLRRLTATRRGQLLSFGALGVVLVLLGSAFLKRVVLPPKRPAAELAAGGIQLPPEEQYGEGVKKFREGNWEGAKEAFERVLAQVPDFQGAKKYSERCDAERKGRDQLAAAKKSLEVGDFAVAKAQLKEIDPAVQATDEAGRLLRTIPGREVEVLLHSARKARDTDEPSLARQKVEEALAILPDHPEALALRAEFERAKPRTARERAAEERRRSAEAKRAEREDRARQAAEARRDRGADRGRKADEDRRRKGVKVERPERVGTIDKPEPPDRRVKPEPEDRGAGPSGPVSDRVAMNHYRNREWGMAITTLRALADKQKGKNQQKTLALAEDIRKLGQSFNRGEGEAARNPVGAIRNYEQAAAIDKRVGRGAHGGYLTQKLSKLTRTEAQKALAGGRYELAYELVRTAERYGGADGQTRAISQALDSKARELFERAYQLKGQRPEEAKGLWRRILKIVPSSSPWYGKSYKYLNEAAGQRQRDEDE